MADDDTDTDTDSDAAAEAGRKTLGRKEFIERAVERSGHKRKAEARVIVEATLATLGEALTEGADINAAPLGRLRMVKERTTGRGRALTLRLAIPNPDAPAARGGAGRDRPRRGAALAEGSDTE